MDSKTKSSLHFNYDHINNYKKIIKQHEYDLELKQHTINQLKHLCDKQIIEIEENNKGSNDEQLVKLFAKNEMSKRCN